MFMLCFVFVFSFSLFFQSKVHVYKHSVYCTNSLTNANHVNPQLFLKQSKPNHDKKLKPCLKILFKMTALSTWQAWADDDKKNVQKCQHSGNWWLYLESPWEMHSNKYKHACYRYRNLLTFKNFWEQNDFVWMVKPTY